MFSKNLRLLTNEKLHASLTELAAQERKLTLEILHHLREVERRRVYAERGHSSLFEYVTKELLYSEASAQRRISAMRALKELPELEGKVESGELKLTQIAQVQSFLKAEKNSGKPYSLEAKRELFQEAIGRSTRETERLLVEKNPECTQKEKIRAVTETLTQITFTADAALLENLQHVRDRFAHRLPAGAGMKDVIRLLAETVLEKEERDRMKGTEVAKTTSVLPKADLVRKKPTRYYPAAVRRLIWRRDEGKCTFVSKSTGRRCGSRHRIEMDHVIPFALGGASDDPRNLRLLCFAHNQLEARRHFGGFG